LIWAGSFVRQVYVPDVLAVAGFYPDWFTRARAWATYVLRGLSGQDHARPVDVLLPRRRGSETRPLGGPAVFSEKVTEHVARSWYAYEDNKPAKHPFEGETKPTYTGPAPPYDYLHVDQKYSWLKAPRYENE